MTNTEGARLPGKLGCHVATALDVKTSGKRGKTAARATALPPGIPPGALTRAAAAAWFMVSPTTFDRMVKERLAPKPVRIFGLVRWRLSELVAALAELDKDEGVVDHDPYAAERMAP
jgi:predicted DNA-binding transcriptional regulator AlpA